MSQRKKQYGRHYFRGWLYHGGSSRRNQNRLRELLRVTRTGRLLDVGCAEGDFLREARHHFDVRGIDVSTYALDQIEGPMADRTTVVDVEEDSLQPDAYDVIVAFNLLEHIDGPARVIRKLFGSLRDGGVLFGSVPNNSGIVGTLATRAANLLDTTHVSTLSPELWRRHFVDSGFGPVRFFGEAVLGGSSTYVRGSHWRHVCQNLMFVCSKKGGVTSGE